MFIFFIKTDNMDTLYCIVGKLMGFSVCVSKEHTVRFSTVF